MSSSIYDTFGNEKSYKLTGDTLVAYLKDATIKFPLPEASSEILGQLAQPQGKSYDPAKVAMINSKLVKAGYSKPNADAMTSVLMEVAYTQGIDPLEYFDVTGNTLNLTVDAYTAMNNLRPAGSRVGLISPIVNSNTRASALIKP